MNRALIVNVHLAERRALLEMSKQDLRAPHDQIRYLIVEEAIRRGLLNSAQVFADVTKNDAGYVLQDTGIAR